MLKDETWFADVDAPLDDGLGFEDCPSPTLFLEASLVPQLDETLSTASQRPREPPQRYMLTLTNGVATERVPTRVAGELTVKMVQQSPPTATTSVTSASSVLSSMAAVQLKATNLRVSYSLCDLNVLLG